MLLYFSLNSIKGHAFHMNTYIQTGFDVNSLLAGPDKEKLSECR